MDARFILKTLKTRHPSNAWIYAAEVCVHTGTNQLGFDEYMSTRFIDAFAMCLWPSKQFWRVAYEIKVDRGDLLRELEQPGKRAQAMYLSNEFWFALAPGVANGEFGKRDLFDCGFLEIQEDGQIKILAKARKRTAWPMPETFIASFLRCVRDQDWK